MDNDVNKNAQELIEIVRMVLDQKGEKENKTVICEISSVNDDGTLDLYILPDKVNVITNVTNQCRYDFKPGDTGLLYLIGNRLSNSFVIAKYNAKAGDGIGLSGVAAGNSINVSRGGDKVTISLADNIYVENAEFTGDVSADGKIYASGIVLYG